jgi:hypothetical protein
MARSRGLGDVYKRQLEWLHSLALTLSNADYLYMEQCFAQHINSL